MSSLINSAKAGARTRVPRFAEAAVQRARLTVVPPRRQLGRTQAARTPFAVLVLVMLAAGVVGLLMFNTNMQQLSFTATSLQDRVSVLTAKQQALDLELDKLRDPQQLAVSARKLGMVAPNQPAFIRLSDGKVLGTPTPATPEEKMRITSLPKGRPDSIKQRKVIVKAKPSITSNSDTPGASTTSAGQDGRNKANTQANSGATR